MMYLHGLRIVLLLTLFALCASCSVPPKPLTPPDSDVPWSYEPDAVVLRIAASDRLNEHEGNPSSLMLCVYELASRGGIDTRLHDPDGFAELLTCGRFDDSVVTSQRIFSDPAQVQQLFLAREEGVRWVAVIAGYFHGTPAHSAYIVPVSVRTVVEGRIPFFKTEHREPGQTIIPVRLGPSEILREKAVPSDN
ncbi:MAG: type VI secretion lipoprotein TssJ [Bilophila sp.]